MWIVISVLVWTVLAIAYVIANLGNKNRLQPKWKHWLEGVALLPVLVIAYIIGFIGRFRQ